MVWNSVVWNSIGAAIVSGAIKGAISGDVPGAISGDIISGVVGKKSGGKTKIVPGAVGGVVGKKSGGRTKMDYANVMGADRPRLQRNLTDKQYEAVTRGNDEVWKRRLSSERWEELHKR